jgi:hypothetical protein
MVIPEDLRATGSREIASSRRLSTQTGTRSSQWSFRCAEARAWCQEEIKNAAASECKRRSWRARSRSVRRGASGDVGLLWLQVLRRQLHTRALRLVELLRYRILRCTMSMSMSISLAPMPCSDALQYRNSLALASCTTHSSPSCKLMPVIALHVMMCHL